MWKNLFMGKTLFVSILARLLILFIDISTESKSLNKYLLEYSIEIYFVFYYLGEFFYFYIKIF